MRVASLESPLAWVFRLPAELDEDRRELGRFLIGLNVIGLVPSFGYLITLLVLYPTATARHLAMASAIALQLTTTTVVRRGLVYRAAAVHFSVFAALIFWTSYRGGGLEGVNNTALLVLIVILSFVPHRWAVLMGTAFASACLVVLYLLERGGLLPASSMTHPHLESLLGYRLMVCVVVGIFATLGAEGLRRARDRARAQQEQLSRRAWQLEGLAELGERALATLDLDALRADALALVRERLDADRLAILAPNGDRSYRLVASIGWGAADPDVVEATGGDELDSATAGGIRVEDFERDGARSALARGARSALVSPIRIDGASGLVCVYADEPGRFDRDHESFLASVAHVLAGAETRLASEEARRLSEAQLHQAHKLEAVGRLASGVAHDFNNLMAVVLTQARLLRLDGHERGDGLEAIEDAATRATAITRKLLALGRNQVLDPEVVDANRVVDGVGRLLERLLGGSHRLTTSLHADPLPVLVDRTQLEQVLMNLALNARDATPDGGTITIRTRAEGEGEDARAVLEVEDQGHGMEPEVLERIFDPFFTTKSHSHGTGLGLAVADGIVRQSGGTIECASEVGRGTLFAVRFPRVAEAAMERPESSDRPTELAPRRDRGWKVLLAEDRGPVRRAVRRALEFHGCEVHEAASGKDALALWDEIAASGSRPVDVLVSDLVMPEIGGLELAERLRARARDLPVLFLSGHPPAGVGELGLDRDGTAFLQKPATPAEIDRALAGLLGG